ncbi:MAG: DUF4919 domain-containing protein [Cyclobacteriaceae bacterium]
MKHFRMLITLALTGACLLITATVPAQTDERQPPDYDHIRTSISDVSSPYYYPTLMAKMESWDTTLTFVDYRFLYYGQLYLPTYSPYGSPKAEEKLAKYYRAASLEAKDYDNVIELELKALKEFPFYLRGLNFLAYIYHLKGDEAMSAKVARRFRGVVKALLSTGDGKTCESGIHVLSINHEYVLLNLFGFRSKSQALTGDCDYLALDKNEDEVEGLYFNVRALMDRNRELFKKK